MDSNKNKLEIGKVCEAKNVPTLMQILDRFKEGWRAHRRLIQKKRRTRSYFEMEDENSLLRKKSEQLESRMAELEKKFGNQKMIAAKRLTGQQYQASLKVKANERGKKKKNGSREGEGR